MIIAQTVTLQPSIPEPESLPWDIHDSNVALHECLSRRNPPIPNEIILQILDDSTRWIRTKAVDYKVPDDDRPIRVGSGYRNEGQRPILATKQLSSLEVVRMRSIVFSFRSRDQGWSDDPLHHGTYEGSWTWMEASLTRTPSMFQSEQEREDQLRTKEAKESVRYELQRNRHAGREPESYRCELRGDHGLLQQWQEGDGVILWARAMFPAWENRVYEAAIEIWSMDDLTGMESTH